ncbi:MAG: molybdopterin-synthase adenylyltransferase MoeB [Burkholderiales bacterium]|nr:MAG: molybdopterin-synthase adenylyltransferase MoeB [Burkholderiales bacterium]
MNDEQLLRYSRHLLLDEIGVDNQQRLLAASALVVGAGGLGSPAAMYLASAGVGRIVLADGDVVDLTNLQRQILHRQASIGAPKAISGQRTIAEINADVEVVPLTERLVGEVLAALVAQATVVLDCSDNFETRHAVNRACFAAGVPLVSGAAIRFDGQVSVYDPRDPESPCYHCLFPEGEDIEEVRCATMGVFAPLTGIVGTIQAAEAIKIAGGFGAPLNGRLLLLDARSMQWNEIRIPRDPRCAVCAARG